MVAVSSGWAVRLMVSSEHLIPVIVFIALVFQEPLVGVVRHDLVLVLSTTAILVTIKKQQ